MKERQSAKLPHYHSTTILLQVLFSGGGVYHESWTDWRKKARSVIAQARKQGRFALALPRKFRGLAFAVSMRQ